MNTSLYGGVGALVAATLIVAGVIFYLQNFDATKVACEAIADARTELQATYDQGVDASVAVYGEEKVAIDERLDACLHAKPVDPCADLQAARDAAVTAYTSIQSPADTASYEEFQSYFMKREEAYQRYAKARDALAECRAAQPPKTDVPYEQSDTKACFDAYDTAVERARTTFTEDTQTMRTALNAALLALDAREKACNPPTGDEKFTDPPRESGDQGGGGVPANLSSCRLLDAAMDPELALLKKRVAAIPVEIDAVETSIENIKKRMSPLNRDLREVDTYIPPESAKTQFEGALNALRAERKVSIESALAFYEKLLERREGEKQVLEAELSEVEAKIAQRLAEIARENEARQKNFPTSLHLAKPDKCDYFHCHGMLCGIPDPAGDGCGHGTTVESDVDCRQFFNAYLKAAGVQ